MAQPEKVQHGCMVAMDEGKMTDGTGLIGCGHDSDVMTAQTGAMWMDGASRNGAAWMDGRGAAGTHGAQERLGGRGQNVWGMQRAACQNEGGTGWPVAVWHTRACSRHSLHASMH